MKLHGFIVICLLFHFSFAFAQHGKEIDEIIRLKRINVKYRKLIEIETQKSVNLYNLAVYNTESGKLLLSQINENSPNAESDKALASKLFDKADLYSKRSDSISKIVTHMQDSVKLNVNQIYILAKTLKISNMDTLRDDNKEVNKPPVVIENKKPSEPIKTEPVKPEQKVVSAPDKPNKTYTVQIRADRVGKDMIKGIPDLKVVKFDDGYYRYFVGEYNTIEEAQKVQKKLVADGYKDAFIKQYKGVTKK